MDEPPNFVTFNIEVSFFLRSHRPAWGEGAKAHTLTKDIIPQQMALVYGNLLFSVLKWRFLWHIIHDMPVCPEYEAF
jgi:hypothetical protein